MARYSSGSPRHGKKCRQSVENAYLVHGAHVWDSMHCSAKQMWKFKAQLLRRMPAYGSRILRILARVSQLGCGHGQPLPRRVCACDAQCSREKRHVHGGPRNRALSDPSVTAWWPFLSITALWCALLKQRTFSASVWAHVCNCFLYFLPNEVFERFLQFFHAIAFFH